MRRRRTDECGSVAVDSEGVKNSRSAEEERASGGVDRRGWTEKISTSCDGLGRNVRTDTSVDNVRKDGDLKTVHWESNHQSFSEEWGSKGRTSSDVRTTPSTRSTGGDGSEEVGVVRRAQDADGERGKDEEDHQADVDYEGGECQSRRGRERGLPVWKAVFMTLRGLIVSACEAGISQLGQQGQEQWTYGNHTHHIRS